MTRTLDPSVTIRAGAQPGDLGWVIARHGEIYAREYGWNSDFEVLVAEIATAFFKSHDSATEHCWFARVNGRNAGCVFLVRSSERIAKLRMLIVEAEFRGLGIGEALVRTCIDFAIACGYERMTLWTNSVLEPARRLYERFGFELVASEPLKAFGQDLISETWELELS
jgi:GNAT superfamily N-acetyltransferase